MESNMTHVSKRKLERDMYPTFLPARKGCASLSLRRKNNKGVSMGYDRRGCFRENYFDFLKLKSEIKKEMLKTKNRLLIKTLNE